jgi:phenylacetate-CoA ligase
VRNRGFWTVDWLRGSSIRKHYNGIKNAMQCTNGEGRTRDLLKSLLTHAVQNCPFYAPYADVPINEFPIIDKDLVRSRYREFLAKPYATAKLHKQK